MANPIFNALALLWLPAALSAQYHADELTRQLITPEATPEAARAAQKATTPEKV